MKNHPQNDFTNRVKRIVRNSSAMLVLLLIGALSPYSEIFLGLALGTVVGIINLIVTAVKVNQIGNIASNQNQNKRTKPVFSGMISRFGLAILAVLIALEYPQYFNLISVLVGLFLAQIIAIVDGLRHSY